jgi:Restriction Endonuclease associating with ARP
VETDEEVALSPDDSEVVPVRQTRMNWAGSLRRELSQRAEQYARNNGLPHCLSYGQPPTVCFEHYDDGSRHGNFLPSTYKAILRNPNWRRRLEKVHSQGRKSLPRHENGVRRELDACTSSDALLMNVFCYPGVFRNGTVGSMLDLGACSIPDFGFRARVPLANGKFDRTEVDMRIADLLIEAKLTEGDFQKAPKATDRAYRDFDEVFDREDLPQTNRDFLSYQLIRNVLAAHASGRSFCVLTDARRPELIEAWYEVMKGVRPIDLRLRCKVLTWQELATALPRNLRVFLSEKYGIADVANRMENC